MIGERSSPRTSAGRPPTGLCGGELFRFRENRGFSATRFAVSTSGYSNPSQTPSSQQSTGSIDEDAVLRAKQEIQTLVQEVVELSRSEIEPGEFYAALIDKSVAALAAIGGVVWTQEEGAPLKLEYQVNLRQTGLAESEEAQIQHGRLLQQVIAKGEPTLVQPHSGTGAAEDGEAQAANPTEFLLVVAPIKSDRGVDGLVEIFQRTGARPTTQRGYLRFLTQICDLAGEFVKTRRLRHFATKQTLWEQLEGFTALVHRALNSRETAYTIANEGRRLIGCDRVTVALRHGTKYQVSAISGQDTFDKRSNVVRFLRKLATVVSRTGEDLWFTGDTSNLAPQVERAVNDYVDESHTKQLAVLPLRELDREEEKPGEPKEKKRENILGAIIIEQLVDSRQPEGMLQRIDVVRRHSSTALTNAQEHEGLFLLPLWRLLGKTRVLVTARNLPKTILATVAIIGAILAMCYVPYDFTVVADGKLMPEVRRDVFAGIDGMVTEVPVNHGQQVVKDQVLARERSVELEEQRSRLDGQYAETLQEIASLERKRQMLDRSQAEPGELEDLTGRIGQLLETRVALEKQRSLLEMKEELLTVTSPIDGKVVTWKVRESIENRPVRKGQRLMEIADPSSPWELEIYVPEAKMGHVVQRLQKLRADNPNAELDVSFILQTHSDRHLTGKVHQIDTIAQIHGESGNTVRMVVAFNQEDLKQLVSDPASDLKVGADVKAKILCGKRSIGYVWFSDLFEFVQSRILFRF
jgi:multidrug efflux pump subunit AcrA (membrane-fusion protein)